MDDDTAGDNNGSSSEAIYGSRSNGTNNFFFDSQLNSTSARQGVNSDGSNYLSAGFGQATGYWNNEATASIPASTASRVRPPLKSMAQGQHPHQPQGNHIPNVNLRRSPLPRHYYEQPPNSATPSQHHHSNSSIHGFDARQQQQHHQQQQQQQQYGHMAMHDHQQPPLMYEDLFSPNILPRQSPQHQDPRLKEFPVGHQQQQQQQQFSQASNGMNGMRPYVMDNSPILPSGLDLFHSEPWDMNEFWTLDNNNPFGGHQLMQHRTSLPTDQLVFQPRSMGGPAPSSSNSSYMSQAAYEQSRRSARGRQDVAPPPRQWIPSQITYDSGSTASQGALAAPPRTIGARTGGVYASNTASSSSSSSRKSSRQGNADGSIERKKPRANYSPMAGENRLKITFMSLGTAGEAPQHFGTKGYIIPNGLSGMHQVYHQRWRFDIRHEKVDDTVVVSWGITNLASGTACQRTETPREARVRETSGHTICNQLLRQALKSRASELEVLLNNLRDNPTKFSNTESLIKALRPKSCILGLLFFGLLHDTVQQRMRDLVGATDGSAHGASASNIAIPASGEDGAAEPSDRDDDDEDLSSAALDPVGDEGDGNPPSQEQ